MSKCLGIFFVNFLLLSGILAAQNDEINLKPSQSIFHYQQGSRQLKINNQAGWEKKRTQILDSMQQLFGKIPLLQNPHSFNISVKDTLKTTRYTRLNFCFTAAPGEIVTALLFTPNNLKPGEKRPAIITLHGTDKLGKMSLTGMNPRPNRAIAEELADRGYIVIAPDYPSFGDMEHYDFKTDRYESGTAKGIFNHIRCIDLLASLNEVNSEQIGAIGHSLGGHNAIFLGAFDTRVKVVVSSCGWTLFESYDPGPAVVERFGGKKLGAWAQDRYFPNIREKYHLDAEQLPVDFSEMIGAIAPRRFFSNSPLGDLNFSVKGVEKGMDQITWVYKLHRKADRLKVMYPDAGHDFPAAVREAAYAYIDRALDFKPNAHQLLP